MFQDFARRAAALLEVWTKKETAVPWYNDNKDHSTHGFASGTG